MRTVIIKPVLNGFIVEVGCATVVFLSIDGLCAELKRYQKNPTDVEKEYQSHPMNVGTDMAGQEVAEPEIRKLGIKTRTRNE